MNLLQVCFLSLLIPTRAWVFNPLGNPLTTQCGRSPFQLQMTADDDVDPLESQQQSDAKREQEMLLESMSLKGAAAVAKMSIPERTKRAMLAEAVEDQIFDLTEELEGLVEEDGNIAVDKREKAVDLAKQVKGLQGQYDDLVNGKPSSILKALEGMNGNS